MRQPQMSLETATVCVRAGIRPFSQPGGTNSIPEVALTLAPGYGENGLRPKSRDSDYLARLEQTDRREPIDRQ